MKDVAGKVAFITGGASGLGLSMARSLTGAGMKVAIADIEDAALEAAKAEFAESNAEVITIKVDVTDRDALEAAAQETEAAFDKVHVVCNNAGVAISGNAKDHGYRDWDWVMGVNLDGVINGVQVFTNRILEHGEGGHIVNTASMAGHLGIPSMSIYNTSKFAVVGLSECLRGDMAPFDVGVSVLCPGFVDTDIFSSQRNRPQALGGSETQGFITTEEGQPSEREIDEFKQNLDGLIAPSLVGDMVLHAIQENELYIFSHPEFKDVVLGRSQAIGEAFDRWAAFRADYE
jgi:NAD(P)-dependent dehydrogenase (short-subunit alcohol dehydrogenase family)